MVLQLPQQAVKAPQATDFERLAEIFNATGTPVIKTKPWVAVDTGPENYPHALHGWLIDDGVKEITVVDLHGKKHKVRRPAPGERRPKIEKESEVAFKIVLEILGEFQGNDYAVAWKVRAEDFSVHGKKLLADGLPKNRDSTGLSAYAAANERFGLADHVIDAARHSACRLSIGPKGSRQ